MHRIVNKLQEIYGLIKFEYLDGDTLQFRLGDDLFEVYLDGHVEQVVGQVCGASVIERTHKALAIEEQLI